MTSKKPASGQTRPASGGYARGQTTRLRIFVTALTVFGAHGFDDASTRAIARSAGVNLGALQYYFGGKEGLYRACVEHIAAYGEAQLGPYIAGLEATLANRTLSREELLALLRGLMDAFAERLVGPADPPAWVALVVREQLNPTFAFDILYQRVMRRVLGTLATLVGRVLGQEPDATDAVLRTLAMLGPLMVLQRARAASLRMLDWPDFGGERLVQVKQVLWDQAMGVLARPGPAVSPHG